MNCAIYWFRVFSVLFAIIYTFGYIGTDGKYTLFPLLLYFKILSSLSFSLTSFRIQNQCKYRCIIFLFPTTHCYRDVSTWVQALTCCLKAPSHYLDHCRFVVRHSPKSNNTVNALENNHYNPFENYTDQIQPISQVSIMELQMAIWWRQKMKLWCSDMHWLFMCDKIAADCHDGSLLVAFFIDRDQLCSLITLMWRARGAIFYS